jgi:ABC-type bacteriocin/lantibiotic exporter with double-glycine peptidase domain
LLSIPHQRQHDDGDCLAACAAMILVHLGQKIDYSRLLQLLKIQLYGAPAGNIRFLGKLNLNITYSQTDMSGLEMILNQGQPPIIFVRTGELPHWTYSTDHAIVVVGYDDNHIYINDPDRNEDEIPIAVPRADFELAWLERDYYYALITS